MSAPFKTPAKKEVKIVGSDDKKNAANKFIQESHKTSMNLFIAGSIDILQCLEMIENSLIQYCKMTGRQADLEMLERMEEINSDSSSDSDEKDNGFIDSAHSQPRWD